MKTKDDTRWFRMIPLAERNWAAMVLAFVALVLIVISAVVLISIILTSGGTWWIWLVTFLSIVAALAVLMGLVTGDESWFMIGLIIADQR